MTERRVLYDYHPWAGRDVCIHCLTKKSGVSVARCRLIGDEASLPLELPMWMFDRLACASVRHKQSPVVNLAALTALQLLLGEVANLGSHFHDDPLAGLDLSADLVSCNQNQGGDYAPYPKESNSTGPVRSARRNRSVADATVGQSAPTDAPQDNGSHGSVIRRVWPGEEQRGGKEQTRGNRCRSPSGQGGR